MSHDNVALVFLSQFSCYASYISLLQETHCHVRGIILPCSNVQRYNHNVSEQALHHSCCRSSKQDSSGTWHRQTTRNSQPYVLTDVHSAHTSIIRLPNDWTGGATQDVHVTPAMDPGSTPSATQPWTKLSMVTCPG